jgi:superfamily II DNA/RNA helicase
MTDNETAGGVRPTDEARPSAEREMPSEQTQAGAAAGNTPAARTASAAGSGNDAAGARDAAAETEEHATRRPRRRRGGRRRSRPASDAAAVVIDPLDDAGSTRDAPAPDRRSTIDAADSRHGRRRPAAKHGPDGGRRHGRPGRTGRSGHALVHDPGPDHAHHHEKRTPVEPTGFVPLGLSDELLRAIGAMGFAEPTPIQEQSIPLLLNGRDVVGCSQTGTGKTLAFVAPIMQQMSSGKHVRALAITPTRELARQIEEVAAELAEVTGHSVAAVFGGVDYERQRRKLKDGVDFLVATPGRLLDLQRRGDLDLSHVKYLVVDEADRLLDMGFWPDVRRIVHSLPRDRQNLLFSATMSRGVLEVIRDTLRSPVHVEVGERATPVENVDQVVLPVNAEQKTDLLVHYLLTHDPTRTLVFTRTKIRADRVARALEQRGISVTPIHSDLGQGQRMQALEGFRSGSIQVLVATDIVARGIDVKDVSHVVNYDVPEHPEDYVHRIGRTARAGASGTAVTLQCADEGYLLKDVERLIGMEIERRDIEGFDYTERRIPRPAELPRRPGKLLYDGGAKRAQKFGLRNVSKKRGRLIKR